MVYAIFCERCKLGSFCDEKIDPFICDKCINNQPERSKREDFDNNSCHWVHLDHAHKDGCTDPKSNGECKAKMRCSELYGDIET